MPNLPATQHAIQFTGAGEVVHNRAKAVPAPGPHPARPRGRGRGDLLLGHQAAARLHFPPAQERGPRRDRAGGARRDPQLYAWRPAAGPRSRVRRPHRRRGRCRGAPSRGRARAGADRLPPPAHRRLERRLRVQLRGRSAGVRPPRRADDPGPRDGRAVPDPGQTRSRRGPPSPCWSRGPASSVVRGPRAAHARSPAAGCSW